MSLLKSSMFVVPLLVASLNAAASTFSVLEIQFTGLDLVFDGGTSIETSGDSPAGEGNALFSIDFILDDVLVHSYGFADGIFADVEIETAAPLTGGGDLVDILPTGIFSLYMPDGFSLITDISGGTISWFETGFVSFSFGAGVSEVLNAETNLPAGLEVADYVLFSFSLNGLTAVDGGFEGSGTGEFVSQVPVPAAAWLFGSALLGMVCVKCRS